MGDLTSSEVERLRARIHDLEAQLEHADVSGEGGAGGPVPRSHRGAWSVTSAVLLVLACFLAPLSVVAVWADTEMSDTDQYVRTVAPLANDPAVQAAVADEVTTAVLESLELDQVTQELLTSLADRPNVPPRAAAALPALQGPITDGIENFTRGQVARFVASDEFAQLWGQVNAAAHAQVVRLLAGDPGGAVTAQDDTVTLNLAPIIARVKQDLVDRGFTLATKVPDVDRSFVLVQSDAVTKAQGVYRLLNVLGRWLPFVVLGLFVLGVLAATDRRRALMRGALGIVASMLLIGVALVVFRSLYVQSTPAGMLSPEAAGDVFDTLVRFLRTGIRATAVLGLVVALVAYLSGPSSAAMGTRSVLAHGVDRLRGGAESAGWRTGRVGVWTYGHKQGLRAVTLVAGGFVLLFWTRPTAWVVFWTAVVVVVVFAVIEFLAQPLVPSPAAVDLEQPPGPGPRSSPEPGVGSVASRTPTQELPAPATTSDQNGPDT